MTGTAITEEKRKEAEFHWGAASNRILVWSAFVTVFTTALVWLVTRHFPGLEFPIIAFVATAVASGIGLTVVHAQFENAKELKEEIESLKGSLEEIKRKINRP